MILPNSITLRPGDSGDYVTELQRRLAQRDLLSEMDITGFYDATTTRAIKTFQSANGLKVDGIAGPETLRLLISIGGEEDSSGEFFDENAEAQERTQGLDRYDEIVYLREVLDDRDIEVAVNAHTQHVIAEHLITESLSKDAIKAVDLTEESIRKNREAEQQRGQEQELSKKQERAATTAAAGAQLEITQQHLKAETLGEALKKDERALEEEKQGKGKDAQHGKEQETAAKQEAATKQDATRQQDHQRQDTQRAEAQEQELRQGQEQSKQRDTQQQREADSREQTQRAAAAQNLTPSGRERIPLDPNIQYFETHLSAASRMETHTEGEKLYARGVREAVMPPGMQLGELVPSQTPNLGQRQQIGIGM